MRIPRMIAFALVAVAFLSSFSLRSHAQAALILEQPYGFFGTLNPTGHDAIYFARICAETPVKLRRCHAGELGSVISRYSGIADYDWVAIPLLPYLYSVNDLAAVPTRVDRKTVKRLRDQYHEAQLLSLGDEVPRGGFLHGGWTELVGVAYERRMYAYRFETTEEQDDAIISEMNDSANSSRFQLLFNNCADFSRGILNRYFPRTFGRNIFPDAGMTTPKQLAYKLLRYAKKHPEMQLQVYEIPQIPGYRHMSRSNTSIAESLITTGYAIPIAILNPYLAGGLFVDYLVRGRHNLIPKDHLELAPEDLETLTIAGGPTQNPVSASVQVHSAADSGLTEIPSAAPATSGLKEIVDTHE
jgi:hypothetical protein